MADALTLPFRNSEIKTLFTNGGDKVIEKQTTIQSSSKTLLVERDIQTLTINDVLFDKDPSIETYVGNVKFRKMIDSKRDEYNLCQALEKAQVSIDIISFWRSQDPPGRFLSKDSKSGLWSEIGNKKAREKISKALRSQQKPKPFADATTSPLTSESTNDGTDTTTEAITLVEATIVNESDDAGHSSNEVVENQKQTIDVQSLLSSNFYKYPEKLYSRDVEIEIIEHTLKRARLEHCKILLITGESGTGKTTLARYVQEHCSCNFIHGRFVQGQEKNIEHSIFGSSISEFLLGLNENERFQIKSGVERMSSASAFMRSDLADILELVPEFQSLIDPSSTSSGTNHHTVRVVPTTSRSGSNDQHQSINSHFKYILGSLLRLLSSSLSGKPLVFFMDDLHWANESDLDVLYSVTNEVTSPGIIFVYTLRLDTVNGQQKNPDAQITLGLGLESIKKRTIEIPLNLMNENQIHTMLTDMFRAESDEMRSLAKVAWQHSEGNLFILKEFLMSLLRDNKLHCNKKTRNWTWNFDSIRHADIHSNSTQNLIVTKFRSLTEEAQDCLILASCLGTKIDLQVLLSLIPSSVSSCFQMAMNMHWIEVNETSKTFVFSHDSIREIIYGSLSESEREAYHHRIGRNIWRNFTMDDLVLFIFVVVNQLILGEKLIKDQRERIGVSKLCSSAGEYAVRISGFHTARSYFLNGIKLLHSNAWREEYELCLSLYSAATECSYSCGDLDAVEGLYNQVIENARSLHDTVRVRFIYLTSFGSRGDMLVADQKAREFLELYGEMVPSRARRITMIFAMKKLKKRLGSMADEDILSLPVMRDPTQLSIMQLYGQLSIYCCVRDQRFVPIVCARMMTLTLDHGICELSGTCFATFATILCVMGFVDDGFRYGQLGYAIQELFHNKNFLARFAGVYYDGVNEWKRPCHESFVPLLKAYRTGLQSGDLEMAMICAVNAYFAVLDREPLAEVESALQVLSDRMVRLNQEHTLFVLRPVRQLIHNLMGGFIKNSHNADVDDPSKLNGAIFNESILDDILSVSPFLFVYLKYPTLFARYLFGRYDDIEITFGSKKAEQQQKETNEVPTKKLGKLDFRVFPPTFRSYVYLFHGLSIIENARRVRRQQRRRIQYKALRTVEKYIKVLYKWSTYEPHNFLGKHLLLDAELYSLCHNRDCSNHSSGGGSSSGLCYMKYVNAIAMSKQSGSIFEHAICNELIAKWLFRQGKQSVSESYGQIAIQSYTQWGAQTKVQHLLNEMKDYWNIVVS